MITLHNHHNYPEKWLAITFSITSGNGVMAIISGLLSSIVHSIHGKIASFDLSIIFLIIGIILIYFNWSIIKQNNPNNIKSLSLLTMNRLLNDKKIRLLAIIQAMYESAMYIFVLFGHQQLKKYHFKL